VALYVGRKRAGGLVPAVAVLLQALHHHPGQLAADQPPQPGRVAVAVGRHGRRRVPERADPGARPGRLLLPDDPPYLVVHGRPEPLPVQRRGAGEQLVQQHPEGVHVRPGVHPRPAHLRLLRAHVQRGTDHLREVGEQRPLGELLVHGLGDPEVDHLRYRHPVVRRHEHVGRPDVAVDDPLLVRVLHGPADVDEQFQPPADRQVALVAEPGDRDAADQDHGVG
jgi:hypothetical protein